MSPADLYWEVGKLPATWWTLYAIGAYIAVKRVRRDG